MIDRSPSSNSLLLASGDRLLVLAPHPDDETLAAGGLIARAAGSGTPVRVLLATDGDHAPWIQRVFEKRWRIRPADRARFGALRREETRRALAQLGVSSRDLVFLGREDQSLTQSLLSLDGELIALLAEELETFRPTLLVAPSLADLHPDHSSLAVIVHLALARTRRTDGARCEPILASYRIHTRGAASEEGPCLVVSLTAAEREMKRSAVRCHATQLAVHEKRMLAFSSEREDFRLGEETAASPDTHPVGPVHHVHWEDRRLVFELEQHASLGAWGPTSLCLVAQAEQGSHEAFVAELHWRRGRVDVRRIATGSVAGEAELVSSSAARRRVTLRMEALAGAVKLFLKLERRFGFFDEAGWRVLPRSPDKVVVVPRVSAATRRPAEAREHPVVCAVIPCYNVAELCAPVVRAAARYAQLVFAVDDGSTDETGRVLDAIAAENERVRVLAFPENRGKGVALLEAFRRALADVPFDVLVTLDADGQHQPADIPALVAGWKAGAELIVGARTEISRMPFRSRVGNSMTAALLKLFQPACPSDTQSGFRAHSRGFVEEIVQSIQGQRYETELQILLFALSQRRRISSVPIPTLYLDGNRSSHFRPLFDSMRIYRTLLGTCVPVWVHEIRRKRTVQAPAGKTR